MTDDPMASVYVLEAKERDTILAALRLWQVPHILDRLPEEQYRMLDNIAGDSGQALEVQEVDYLCEYLNCGGTTPDTELSHRDRLALLDALDRADSFMQGWNDDKGAAEGGAGVAKDLEVIARARAILDRRPNPEPVNVWCCATCLSPDITSDALARFNRQTGEWELSGLLDNTDCAACGGECSTVEISTALLMQPWHRKGAKIIAADGTCVFVMGGTEDRVHRDDRTKDGETVLAHHRTWLDLFSDTPTIAQLAEVTHG